MNSKFDASLQRVLFPSEKAIVTKKKQLHFSSPVLGVGFGGWERGKAILQYGGAFFLSRTVRSRVWGMGKG